MAEDTNAPPKPLSEEVIQLKLAMREKNRFLQLAYEAGDITKNMWEIADLIAGTTHYDTSGRIFRNFTEHNVPFFDEWCDKNSFYFRNYSSNTRNADLFMCKITIAIGNANETLIAVGLHAYLTINKMLEAQFNRSDFANDEELHNKRQTDCLDFWVNSGVDCIIINPSFENYSQLSSASGNFFLPAVLDFAKNTPDLEWKFDNSNFIFPVFFFGECNKTFSARGTTFHDITYFFTNFKSKAIFSNASFLEYTCFWQNTFFYGCFTGTQFSRRVDFFEVHWETCLFKDIQCWKNCFGDSHPITPPLPSVYSLRQQATPRKHSLRSDEIQIKIDDGFTPNYLTIDQMGLHFVANNFYGKAVFTGKTYNINIIFSACFFSRHSEELNFLLLELSHSHINISECIFSRKCVFAVLDGRPRQQLHSDLDLSNTLFKDGFTFKAVEFHGKCTLQGVRTEERCSFENVLFAQNLMMDECTWEKGLDLKNTEFKGDVDLSHSTSNRALNIEKCHFHKKLLLKRVQLGGGIKIAGDIKKKSIFRGPITLESAKLDSLSLEHAEMAECPNLLGADLKSPISIRDTEISLPAKPKSKQKPMVRKLIDCFHAVLVCVGQELSFIAKEPRQITKREVRLEKIATYFRRIKQLADEAKDFKHALDYLAKEQQCLARAKITTWVERALFQLYLNLCNAGRDFFLPICWLIFLIIASGSVVASGSVLPLAFFGLVAIGLLLIPLKPLDAKLLLFLLSILGCVLFGTYYGDSTLARQVSVLSDLLNATTYTAMNAVSFSQIYRLLDGTIDGLQAGFPPPFNNQPGEYASLAILFSKTISLIGLILVFLTVLCIRNFLRLK